MGPANTGNGKSGGRTKGAGKAAARKPLGVRPRADAGRTRKRRASRPTATDHKASELHASPDAALFVEAGPAHWEAVVTSFLRRHVAASGAKGVMLGVSGGLDSAVMAGLAVRALGKSKVVPVLMPTTDSDPRDTADGRKVCKWLGLAPVVAPISSIVDGVVAATRSARRQPTEHALANAKSRARVVLLYALAQSKGLLVCGTGNKSELLAGYFTKWGDGSADMQPIGDLYKTQVRQLARHLGVPRAIIDKPPSAGLRPGQTDEADMGVSYEELDAVLKGIELNHGIDAIVRKTGLSEEKVARVEEMVRRSEHKRHMPLIPKIGARTVGIDWRRPVHWDA